MSKAECSVCFENIKKTVKHFRCDHCKKYICKPCLKDCIITFGDTIPKCPDCRTSIPLELLAKLYSKKFVKTDLIEHITNLQFEVSIKEKSKLIIETLAILCQDLSNYDIYRRNEIMNNNYRLLIYHKNKEYKISEIILPNLDDIFKRFCDELKNIDVNDVPNLNKQLEGLLKFVSLLGYETCEPLLNKYYKPLMGLDSDIKFLKSYNILGLKDDIKEKLDIKSKGNKVEYLLRCTECELGFITSKFKCTNCKKQFCDKCLIEISEGHECNKDDVDNLQFILSNTKPCPNCYTRISKISGCNQMFCTFCHKGFDWQTGKIIKSNFHNPHRMEWLHNGGIDNLNENECVNNYQFQVLGKIGLLPTLDKLLSYKNHCLSHINKYMEGLNEINNEINELTDLSRYLYWDYYQKHKNIKVVKELMLNEKQYKSSIERNEKKKFRYELYIETYQNIVDLCNTVLIRIDQLLVTNERIIEYNRIRSAIRHYEIIRFNTIPTELQHYGNKLKIIDDLLVIDKNYKTELQNYIMSIDQIKSLVNNCFKLLKEIEDKRINELEQYMDMSFDRPVYDLTDDDMYMYYWSAKYGFKDLKTMLEWYKILSKQPNEDEPYTRYPSIEISFYSITYKKIKYIQHEFTLRNYAYTNVYKLPTSENEKAMIYNILAPNNNSNDTSRNTLVRRVNHTNL